MEGKPTDYFEMGVEVTLSQQRFWQLPQEDLEHGCHVIGVVVPRLQVDVRPVVSISRRACCRMLFPGTRKRPSTCRPDRGRAKCFSIYYSPSHSSSVHLFSADDIILSQKYYMSSCSSLYLPWVVRFS